MAEKCVSLGCPEFLRLAKQDPCSGAPIPGAANGAIIRCSRNVTIEQILQDADTSTFTSDCNIPDEYVTDAFVKGYTPSLETSRISPQLIALLLGYDMLQDGGVNVGYIEEAVAGCKANVVRPSFILEAFYRVRQCDAAGGSTYLRRVLQGVKFAPVEQDKEGQITFERLTGTSVPALTAGLVNPVSGTAGPFQDFPDDINDDLAALDADHLNVGLRFVDPIADPSAGLTEVAGTCFMVAVPTDV